MASSEASEKITRKCIKLFILQTWNSERKASAAVRSDLVTREEGPRVKGVSVQVGLAETIPHGLMRTAGAQLLDIEPHAAANQKIMPSPFATMSTIEGPEVHV